MPLDIVFKEYTEEVPFEIAELEKDNYLGIWIKRGFIKGLDYTQEISLESPDLEEKEEFDIHIKWE